MIAEILCQYWNVIQYNMVIQYMPPPGSYLQLRESNLLMVDPGMVVS